MEITKTVGTGMTFSEYKKALIIGAGPSLKINIQELQKSKWKGPLFATDRALHLCLEEGLVPDYVVTLEEEHLEKHFEHEIIKEYADQVMGLTSEKTYKSTKTQMRKMGLTVQGVGTHKQIHSTSNCGLFIMMILSYDFKCKDVYMIGMDHSFERGRTIQDTHPECTMEKNPYDGYEYCVHPLHSHWRYNFIDRMGLPDYKQVRVTNCTGRGVLFGGRIIWKDSILDLDTR